MSRINKSVRVKRPYPGIYYLEFKDGYYAATTMMRPQEFYESPDPKIRNKFFTIEDLMDSFIERYGKFSYYDDYGGFNIPDYSIERFYRRCRNSLTKKEDRLFHILLKHTNDFKNKPFYVIATYEKDVREYLDHEIAHGLYYLYENYRLEVDKLIERCSYRKHMNRMLIKKGYSRDVVDDETQAYLATSNDEYLLDEWGIRNPRKAATPFRNYFKSFRKSLV